MRKALPASRLLRRARQVIDHELAAVRLLRSRLGDEFRRAVKILRACRGKVVVSGMGKSGLIARKVAATLSSTGCPAFFLYPADALHGDLGALQRHDVLLVVSNSGETAELTDVLTRARELGVKVIAMVGETASTIGKSSQAVLDCSVPGEAGALGLAPSASTTACLVMGDALALVLSESKGFTRGQFARLHPGGSLGERLCEKVGNVCRCGKALPSVTAEDDGPAVIAEINRGRMGAALVLDRRRRPLGIVVDGDLRRAMARGGVSGLRARDLMSPRPVRIAADAPLSAALQLMEERAIYHLVVTDAAGKVKGLAHIHDLLGRGKVRFE